LPGSSQLEEVKAHNTAAFNMLLELGKKDISAMTIARGV
jgi:hypothetical protein